MSLKDHQYYYHFEDENKYQPHHHVGRKRTNLDAFSNPLPGKNAEAAINLLEDDDSFPDNQQSGGATSSDNRSNINIITRINDLDVLKGRGAAVNVHFGNQQLYNLVDSLKDEYWKTPKLQKMEICQRVLTQIQQRGGRFLQPIGCTNTEWAEITDEAALAKISQCFRDRIKQEFDESTKKRPWSSTTSNQNIDYISEATKIQNQPAVNVPQHANATKPQAQFKLDDAMTNSSRILTPERNQPYHPQPRAKDNNINTFNLSVDQGHLNVYSKGTHQQLCSSSSLTQNPSPSMRTEKIQQHLIQVQTQVAKAQLAHHEQQQKQQNWQSYTNLSEKAIALRQKIQNGSSSNPQDVRSYSLLLDNLKGYLLELEEQLNILPHKSVASTLMGGSSSLSSLPGNANDTAQRMEKSATPPSSSSTDVDTDGGYIETI